MGRDRWVDRWMSGQTVIDGNSGTRLSRMGLLSPGHCWGQSWGAKGTSNAGTLCTRTQGAYATETQEGLEIWSLPQLLQRPPGPCGVPWLCLLPLDFQTGAGHRKTAAWFEVWNLRSSSHPLKRAAGGGWVISHTSVITTLRASLPGASSELHLL